VQAGEPAAILAAHGIALVVIEEVEPAHFEGAIVRTIALPMQRL